MNKKILKFVGTIALVCIAATLFTGASEDRENEDIRYLLQKRTFIMENVLFGRISCEEGREQLKEIEAGGLYQRDSAALLDYRCTDLSATEKMGIVSLEKKSQLYDRASYEAQIKWTESYGVKMESRTCLYEIGVLNNDDTIRLISFDIK